MITEFSRYLSATASELKESREARVVTYFILFMLFLIVWLPAPVEKIAVPGKSMEFYSSNEVPLNVIALTVRTNKNNAETVKNWWYNMLPNQIVHVLADGGLGLGQAEARLNASLAVQSLTGWELKLPDVHTTTHVTGTSSGLGWALATLAQNDPGFLKDLRVATTGTIESTGEIKPVGMVSVKAQSSSLSNIDILLLPQDQYAMVVAVLKDGDKKNKLKLKGVRNLSEAVEYICAFNPSSLTCSKTLSK